MPQSLSKIFVHLVFSTQHREPMLLQSIRAPMHAYLPTAGRPGDGVEYDERYIWD